jgi:hypothetical protein
MMPQSEIIKRFVWQPVSEVDTEYVFAFGWPWNQAALDMSLPLLAAKGAGGADYGSAIQSRAVRLYGLPGGQRLVVEWHSGGAGPPSVAETELLRSALEATA